MSADAPPTPTARARPRRAAVVGAGVAGLAATLALAERGVPVDLYAMAPARWSRSAGGVSDLAAALDLGEDGDDAATHLADARRAGRGLGSVRRLEAMIASAPTWVERLARFGVPFERTAAGRLSTRGAPGAARRRALHAGTVTGRLVLHALDEQVRRLERTRVRDERGAELAGEPLVRRREGWELLDLVLDDAGRVVGVVLQDLRSMVVQVARHDGVLLATGGASGLFDPSAASRFSSGAGAARAARKGAVLADPDAFAWRPALFALGRLVPDALLVAGARVWLPPRADDLRAPREIPGKERTFLLDRVPSGALPPDSTALGAALARALRGEDARAVDPSGARVRAAYLETPSRGELAPDLADLLDAYARRTGVDPALAPWLVEPAVECWLGGLWTDHESDATSPRGQATTLAGLYAAGEVAAGPHGAGLLGGDALLSCLATGDAAARALSAYREGLPRSAHDLPAAAFDAAERDARTAYEALLDRGTEEGSHLALYDELTASMRELAGPEREPPDLEGLAERLAQLTARAQATRCADTAAHLGRGASLARGLDDQLWLAGAVLAAAKRRAERAAAAPIHVFARVGPDGAVALPDRFTLAMASGEREVDATDEVDPQHAGSGGEDV